MFFSRERPRSPVKAPRAVRQVASDDDFSVLGRALTATRKLDPDKEKKMESHMREENPDRFMLGGHLRILRVQVEAAIAAVEQR